MGENTTGTVIAFPTTRKRAYNDEQAIIQLRVRREALPAVVVADFWERRKANAAERLAAAPDPAPWLRPQTPEAALIVAMMSELSGKKLAHVQGHLATLIRQGNEPARSAMAFAFGVNV